MNVWNPTTLASLDHILWRVDLRRREEPPARTALRTLDELVTLIRVLPLPLEAAKAYGAIRADLERRGQMIGSNDLWIAAHALVEGLVLVTSNVREFRRVEKLTIENWVR